MARVLYARERRTERVWPFLVLHDEGSLTTDDPQMAKAIPRYRELRGWSNERIFEYWKTRSNVYCHYFEESGDS